VNVDAQEVELTVAGRTVPIWIVRVAERLFIRSYLGERARWYRHVQATHTAHIDGVEVRLVGSHDLDDEIDDAYYAKYGHSVYADAMVAPQARATTLEVLL